MSMDGSQTKHSAAAPVDIRAALVGDISVGKTSIAQRFIDGKFNIHQLSTTGASFLKKMVNMNGDVIKFQIWDTAGQEKFRSITPMYYRSAEIIILVYDVTRKDSFRTLEYWLKEIREKAKPNSIIAVVGNKIDKEERQVTQECAQEYCQQQRVPYYECSAFSGEGINKIFEECIKERRLQMLGGVNTPRAEKTQLVSDQETDGCC